jgi:hypothetical protein
MITTLFAVTAFVVLSTFNFKTTLPVGVISGDVGGFVLQPIMRRENINKKASCFTIVESLQDELPITN